MLRKNIGSQILLFSTMAMMDERLWGRATDNKGKRKSKERMSYLSYDA